MDGFFESVPYAMLTGWLFFSVWYLVRTYRRPDTVNQYLFDSIPQVFPTLGILGTFIGIAVGLFHFDVEHIETSIPALLQGLKTAFIASIFGIILSIIFSKLTAYIRNKNEKGKLTPETIALNKLIELVSGMRDDFASQRETPSDETIALNKLIEVVSGIQADVNSNFTYVNENNQIVKPGNVFRDLYMESTKQSKALQSFSTDLSTKIEAGFDTIMSTQIQRGVIPELQALKQEVTSLGTKLQEPQNEMTHNVVNDLKSELARMIDEFTRSMSGSAKTELEQLANLMTTAGSTLADFPNKLQSMTDHLNAIFIGLQEVVRDQSEKSTDTMRLQVEEMSKILRDNIGDLQRGQRDLVEKQSGNLQVSDRLLSAFNSSIDKMNGLSVTVTETVSRLREVQTNFGTAAAQLSNISENVNRSSSSFKDAQLTFSQHSNEFLDHNAKTIQEIQASLLRAKEVSVAYAQSFSTIESGLQGIFEQIQTGLTDYRTTIGGSIETYLGEYTDALTKTAESLAAASSMQHDIVEELTEQLTILNRRRSQ